MTTQGRPTVVVIGAGSAGAVLAARLSQDPARRVMLLEAGPDERSADEPAAISGPSFMDACAEPGRTWPDLVVRRTAAQEPRVYQRGRGAGGSSAVNAMVAIPGIAEDYDRWEDLGATGWGWDELSPWFARTALELNPADRSEWGPVNRALVEALPNAAGAVPLTRTTSGRRASTNDVYLEPAHDRENLEVRGDALVDRVLLTGDGRQSAGVRLASGEEIEAGAVIVSAGAIHSPAILLRSSIDRPAIGANLRDHPAFPVPITLADGVPWNPDSLTIATLARLSSGEAAADLQLLPLDHVGRDGPNLAMMMVALMRVRSKGTVRLASDDPNVDPEVDFAMLSDPVDRRRLRIGVERLLEVLDHRAMRALGTPIVAPHDDAGLDTNLGDYVHAAGTCRMGSVGDKAAVVDPSCQVIGYEGLWVCDASVMPDLPRANTHLTTVVVAERVAAMLAERWAEEGDDVSTDLVGYTNGLHEVGDGCFAYLQPDGGWGWSNAGLVVGDDTSLLVDTLFDLELTAEMLSAMAPTTRSAPISTVVNTHANGDHCYGNQLLAGTEIVASTATAEEMADVPPSTLAALNAAPGELGELFRRFFGAFHFEGIEPTPPTRTFDGRLELDVGGRIVELIEVGPAHTRGDTIVHVPQTRTVFTGDILFINGTPIVWAGPLSNWIAACDLMLGMDVDVVVPGHGPVTDKGGVAQVRDYLSFVEQEATARFDAGMDAWDAARDIALGGFADWGESGRLAVNVEAVYRQLDPAHGPDIVEQFRRMAVLEGLT